VARLAIVVEYEIDPDRRPEFLDRLRAEAAATLRDDGCLRMEVLLPRDRRERVLLAELWRDEEALAAHRDAPGHSHVWQEAFVRGKRVTICEIA
jgi:quinol monooxygenase YgiN